jgi:hypothetical protein
MKMAGKMARCALAAVVVAGTLGATNAFGASGAGVAPEKAAKQAGPTSMQIRVFEPLVGGSDKLIDLGRPGPSAGDTTLSRKPTIDPDTEQSLGTDVTRVQAVEFLTFGDVVVILDCTANLPDGAIMFYGSFRFSDPAPVWAVIGGNGAYAGASGTVTGTADNVGGDDGTLLTFDITLD